MSLNLMPIDEPKPLTINEGPGALLSALVGLAQRGDTDPATVAAWAALHRDLKLQHAKRLFIEAKQRLDIPRVKKNGTVELKQGSYNFGKFEDMMEVIDPLLRAEGFSLSFDTQQLPGVGITVIAILTHVGEHEERSSVPVPVDTSGGKNSIQGYGSALSYGKRYATAALLNIVFEGQDDDGKRGGERFLSVDQAAEIVALVKETNTDEAAMLQHVASYARSVEEVHEADFVTVKNALLRKKAIQAKAAAASNSQ